MKANLTGIPETMLWTLHNRAAESSRDDHYLKDPEAERIYGDIDYNYEASFGPASPSHSVRSAMFDHYLSRFLEEHPDGVIVNLGEGLETQRYRIQGDDALWLSVDLPEAMAVRERFIKPDEKHKHVACSALDEAWHEEVPRDRAVYITAQGLLMYMEESQVRLHLESLARRFPGAWYAFDVIPRWLSRKSTSEKGWWQTPDYRVPEAPWGINRNEIIPTMKKWVPTLQQVVVDSYRRFPRGFVNRYVFFAFSSLPGLRRGTPCITRIQFSGKEQPPPAFQSTPRHKEG